MDVRMTFLEVVKEGCVKEGVTKLDWYLADSSF